MSTATLRFLLDGREIHLDGIAPTTTVLNWLREDAGRTGTKEGCAEGDCGACTVVVAEACDGRLRWRAINACIRLLPTLHGKALFTVESLRAADGGLHPAQQALVDCHGSQCGFCTPGFVMSLFGLYQTEAAPDRQRIDEALSGNLCRCTGYRPIIDAAHRMYALPAADALPPPAWRDDREGETALRAKLAALDDGRTLELATPAGRFIAPRTAAAFAAARLAQPEATVLAGGTDVGLWLTKQLRALPALLYAGAVAEFARIIEPADQPGALEIGAAVTLDDAFGALLRPYPELTELQRRFASRPIRNAGTLCGNIANGSPIGDALPALIALGAEVVLRRGDAVRRLALEDFYLDYRKQALAPGEFVAAVRVPARPAARADETWVLRAWKVSRRTDQDIAAVFAAFALHFERGTVRSARLVYGGMAGTPKRAAHAEAVLRGQPFDDAALADAQTALTHDFQPLTDLRASAGYRLAVAQNLLTRLQLDIAGTAPTRVDAEECRHACR